MPKGLVIIPTYNEAENISEIIPKVLAQSSELDVLIIDDASPDGTGEIVEKMKEHNPRIHLIRREKKMGLGTAYITGFKFALQNNYDYAIEMDADFSHSPDDLPRLIENLEDADLVIGSRYCQGVSVVNWPMRRLLLSFFANLYARKVTGCPIRDLTAGFKAYKREALAGIDLDRIKSDGYGFQIEIDTYIWRRGFKVKEIPIIFVERRAGVSKMSKRIIYQAFFLVLRLGLERLLGKE
jgi:dolichol-phosphate mannosyltransferase|uniref:Polyprenol monophosphomannose synthase n=1 Tax=candidate division WOR-3 bacterium TaxID=2052148 RepID=A0A7C3YSC7_UNCW3